MADIQKKIKLVVVINDFRMGGAQKVVCSILQCFDFNQFEVHVISLKPAGSQPTFYDQLPREVSVHQKDFGGFLSLSGWRNLYRLLRELQPTVVWSNLFFSNTVTRILGFLFSYRVVIVEHNTYRWKKLWQRLIDHLLAYRTDTIVAVSEEVKKYTAKQIWLSEKKFRVIHNGVNLAQFQKQLSANEIKEVKAEFGWSEDTEIIICVGQFIKQKNHTLLIEAYAEFVKLCPKYRLLIIGEGSLRPQYELQIKLLGLKSLVALPGIKSDPAPYYQASRFFVLPSLFEGFGIVCIEAMAAGLPVIATKVAGPTEYIVEGKNGYLIDLTQQALLKSMIDLADQLQYNPLQFKTAVQKSSSVFNVIAIAHKYKELLLQVSSKNNF